MSSVQADFDNFFLELHGRKAFPWQSRLAQVVCEKGWPKVIDLPTGSGKTACIDIALFALAVRRKDAPRRIFFIVDRRVIVSEAYERAKKIKRRLKNATDGVLKAIADELRQLSGDKERPLCTYELRGGAFRDETWVRTPLQPAVIASTVDQAGSRLLFRGYGVSENTWPMHAGLIANDAILFLDEAHCSRAFAQTLEAVEQYRSGTWASDFLGTPFHFVEMTATPTRGIAVGERFTINAEDLADEVLKQRIFVLKPTRLLEPVKCKKDELTKFAAALIDEATTLANEVDAKRVAIMVNRVSTAKEVHRQLCRARLNSILVIGRMRPLDRDSLENDWKPFKSGMPRDPHVDRLFVVSTQCLEVGADLDFDVLVSECASIDALQQRFGRLDRIGDFKKARGAIVAGSWQVSGKDGDPVYGEALQETWKFLESIATDRLVNMGIESSEGEKTIAEYLNALPIDERTKLILQGEDAPMLLPAHLDALVQTSPQPEPEPFIEYFLHGPKRGTPDVYVVWRSDINGRKSDDWAKIVALCPPSSSEAMPVPLWVFRKWLEGNSFKDESDTELAACVDIEEKDADGLSQPILIWKGLEKSWIEWQPRKILAGATVVLPSVVKGWDALGFKPESCRIDRGDDARLKLRRRICLRLHPNLLDEWEEFSNREELKRLVSHGESEPQEIWDELEVSGASEFQKVKDYCDLDGLNTYPVGPGWILEGYFGEKKSSRDRAIFLNDHLKDVEAAVESITGHLLPSALKGAVETAAHYHDYGKADIRFQAWLRNGDEMAARYALRPIAKSGKTTVRKQTECRLPTNFRHELLSLLFAANATDIDEDIRDLVLHLVASHHGRCRPFAPLSLDDQAECVEFANASICRKEIVENPPFSLGRGVAERFWKLTRQYGWWGLAYLEAMLRLADWKASDDEKAEVLDEQ